MDTELEFDILLLRVACTRKISAWLSHETRITPIPHSARLNAMNAQELALARIMFQNRVLSCNGQAYEDLFTKIMGYAHTGFVQVKPQGSIGDRKNDGYDPQTGHYYQVFSPENPELSESQAVKKLKTDFTGLRKFWEKCHPVKSFSFAFNDKYRGTFPTIEADLAAIKNKHNLASCGSFLAKHLEEKLFGLPDDRVLAVIGHIPNPAQIENIDYSILRQVINVILATSKAIQHTTILEAPEFEGKITFNGLGLHTASLLRVASYQVSAIDNYFRLNADYIKQELRDAINRVYHEAVEICRNASGTNGTSQADLVFFRILTAITPSVSKPAQDAALVVMAYFFESCDIFEDPKPASN